MMAGTRSELTCPGTLRVGRAAGAGADAPARTGGACARCTPRPMHEAACE